LNTNDKTEALNPDPAKQSTWIATDKYEQMKSAILAVLKKHEPIEWREAMVFVEEELTDFDGSIGWYYTTVKLDFEARGLIERSKGSPQILSLPS